MSTEVIDRNLDLLRGDLVEYINDTPLDMLDEFTDEEIADKVIDIAKTLMVRDFTNGHLIKHSDNRLNIDYLYKVNNHVNGFVSLSDCCSTGVSRTCYKPFFVEGEGFYAGLCNLADMLNESWYLLKND